MLPFTREQFIAVFAQYNLAIWPAQVVAALLGAGMVVALWRRTPSCARIATAGLALMWLWTGVGYHALFFARINPAAFAFAALFVLQGLLFTRAASTARYGTHRQDSGLSSGFGWALVLYAGAIYPLIGLMAGHNYPATPVFGVTPCPVTLFTFGVLLIGAQPVPRHLLVIPALWAAVGGSAAFLLGIVQDWPLLVGGLAAAAMLWRRGTPHVAAAPA
jgi:hypothetical protein